MPFNGRLGRFPCPVCTEALEVRESKKGKPYVICDPCGVQMFVRQRGGISAFNDLVERADSEDVWARLRDLAGRYRLKCPKCGREFWIEQELVETDWMDGDFMGFRCPTKDCGKIVPWEGKKK